MPDQDSATAPTRQLKDEAYEQIKNAITSLRFAPGASIGESQLVRTLGISKTPIRMALIRLEQEGFVETRRASGTFVRRMTFDDVLEIFEVRLPLEQCAVSQLVASASETDTGALQASIVDARSLVQSTNASAAFDAVNEFHLQLVDLARNRWLSQTYRTLFDHIVRIGNVCGRIPGRNERSLAEHEALVAAIAARDEARALCTIADHLASVLSDYGRSAHSNHLLDGPVITKDVNS